MLLMQLDENNIMINLATAERNDRPDIFITAPEGTTFDDLGKRWTGTRWEEVPAPEPQPPEPTQEERLEKIEKKLDRIEAIHLETAMQIIEPPSFDGLPEIPEGELPPLPDMNSLDPDLLKELMSGSIPELP